VDGANSSATDCFYVNNSGVSSLSLISSSFDDCQVHILQANNVTIVGGHFENPGSATWKSYTYMVIDNNTATNVSITGSTFYNDTSVTNSPTTFISNGGTVTLNGVIARRFSTFTVPSFITTTGSGRASWIGFNNVSGAAVTSVLDSQTFAANGANTTSSYTGNFLFPNMTSTVLGTDSNGNVIATSIPTIATTTKNIYDMAPSSTDDIVMLYTETATTLKQVDCVNDKVAGNTATFNITWGANRNSTTSNAFTSNFACTATTTISTNAINGSTTIPAGSIVRAVFSAASSTGIYIDFKF
jgi:hypothetical protein